MRELIQYFGTGNVEQLKRYFAITFVVPFNLVSRSSGADLSAAQLRGIGMSMTCYTHIKVYNALNMTYNTRVTYF